MGNMYDFQGNVVCENRRLPSTNTDAQCRTAFLEYMNEKATDLGMSGTHYASASGLTQSSYSTPQDGMKLIVAVASYREAMRIWATPSRSFTVVGEHARTVSISNNVITGIGAMMETAGHKFLGGKGGSLIYNDHHKAQLYLVDVSGKSVALSLMALGETGYNSIYQAAVELADMVAASLAGNTPTEGENLAQIVEDDGGYAACVLPLPPGAYVNLETPAELLTRANAIYNAPTVSRYPASTSKTMTMLCALDYMTDPFEIITVKSTDIEAGSGSTFYDGDKLRLYDALCIMMMESSNTMAQCIGRVTGNKILRSKQ